jgi:hypothetical protein
MERLTKSENASVKQKKKVKRVKRTNPKRAVK